VILASFVLCLAAGTALADRYDAARAREALLAELTLDYERGENERVIAVLSDSLAAAEFTPRLYNLLGLALAAQARHPEAVSAYETGMREGGIQLFELHVNLGLSLQALGISGRAMSEFQRAVEIAPQELEARLALGKGYLDYGRYSQARTQLEEAARLAPRDPRVLRQRARLADDTGNVPESLTFWAQLEARQPDADSARRLGELHATQVEEAIGWYRLCAQRDSLAADCDSALGSLLMALERDAEALPWLRRAEASPPAAPQLVHNLLLGYQRTGAIDSLEAVLGRHQLQRADSWGVVALARRSAGRGSSALDAAAKAHEMAPEDPDLANIYAVLLHENGREAEAQAVWRGILQTHPEHPQARSNLDGGR